MVSREPVSPSSPEDCQVDNERLLEELQVQQEELELQNEELRLAQLELERTRNEHAEFYQLAPMGFLTLDSSLHIMECNEAIAKLLNIEIKNLINSHIIRFIPSESQIHFMEHIELAGRNGSHTIDLRLGRCSRTFIGHFITYVAANGATQKYRMVIEDVTERKKAEEALKESENRFSTAFHANPTAMAITEINGAFVDINDRFRKLTGFTRDEVVGGHGMELGLFADPSEREEIIRRLQESGRVSNYEMSFRHKSGKSVRVIFSLEEITFKERPHFLGTAIDITERKQAEEELKESEEKFKALAETSAAIIVLYQGEHLTYANRAAEQITGFSRDELLGKRFWELVHPDFQVIVKERGLARQRSDGVPASYEFKILTKDGGYRRVESTAATFKMKGQVTGIATLFDITDRKRAEEELSMNFAILAKSQEIAHLGSWSLNFFTGEFEASDEDYRIYGLEPQTPTFLEQVWTMIHPDDLERYRKYVESVQKEGCIGGIDYRIIRPNGSLRYVNAITDSVVRDSEGKVKIASGTTQDITERKELEEALRESEAKFRELSDASPAAVAVYRGNNVLYVNQAAVSDYGYSKEEILSMDFLDLIHPEYRDIVHARAMRHEPGIARYEIKILKKSGVERWADISSVPIIYEGSPAGLAVSLDVTDRKKAEEALKESEERFRVMADGVPTPIWVTDAKGERIFANRKYREFFGVPSRPTEKGEWQRLVHQEDSTSYIDEFMSSLEERRPFFAKARVWRADGQWRWIESHAEPRFSGDGEFHGYVGFSLDMTERKQAEEALKQTAENLSRSNADLQSFAYVASHDLKEPIRMIASYLGLLERKYKGKVLDERAEEYLDFALEGAKRMNILVSDLLEYSRVETRGRDFTPLSMNEVVGKAIGLLKVPIHENEAEITVEPLPRVLAYENQMIQLMQNLVGNAIKFHREERPVIQVSAASSGRFWKFVIKDNGIGIDAEFQEQIFQMFRRLHTSEEYEGTGIGLAIAKRIVERHGGRIWMESDGKSGSTFFFTIPKS